MAWILNSRELGRGSRVGDWWSRGSHESLVVLARWAHSCPLRPRRNECRRSGYHLDRRCRSSIAPGDCVRRLVRARVTSASRSPVRWHHRHVVEFEPRTSTLLGRHVA